MARLRDGDRTRFPLETIGDVVCLFRDQLEDKNEPNLALLSILLGILEHSLTVNRPTIAAENSSTSASTPAQKYVEDVYDGNGINKHSKQSADVDIKTADSCEKRKPIDVIPAVQLSDVEALYEQFVTLIKGSVDMSYHRENYTSPELLKLVSDVVWTALTRTYYKDRAHLHTLYTMLTDNKMDCFGMALGVIAACQVLGLNDVHLALSEDHTWAVFGEHGCLNSEITWHGKGTEDRRGQPITDSTAEKSWLYSHPLIGNRHVEVAAMVLNINPAINASCDSVEMAVLQQQLLWLLYDLGHLKRYPLALGVLADMEEMKPTHGRQASFELYIAAVEVAKKHYDDMNVYPYTYLGNYYYRHCLYKEALKNWAAASQVISRYNYNKEDEEIYKEFLEIANDIIPNLIRISSGETTSGASSHFCEARNPLVKPHDSTPFLSDPECYANLLRLYDGICEWEEGSSKPVLHIVWANHMAYSISRFDLKARENVSIVTSTSVNKDNLETPETEPRKRLDRRRESDVAKEEGTRNSTRSATSKVSVNAVSDTDASNQKEKNKVTKRVCDGFSSGLGLEAIEAQDLCVTSDTEFGLKDPNSFPSADGRTNHSNSVETEHIPCSYKDETKDLRLSLVLHSEKMMGMKELLVSRKLNTSAIKLQLTAQSQLSLKQNQPAADAMTFGPPQKRTRRE